MHEGNESRAQIQVEHLTRGGTRSPLRSAGAPCDVMPPKKMEAEMMEKVKLKKVKCVDDNGVETECFEMTCDA